MKSIWIVTCLIFLVFANLGWSAPPANELVVLYTGDTLGDLEPCGCSINKGGLARRASMIDFVREQHPNVILLDCGDTISERKSIAEERARTIWSSMEMMRYDVLNVAEGEVSLGFSNFEKMMSASTITAISANLHAPSLPTKVSTKVSMIKPFVVKKIGPIRVGILGITKGAYNEQTPLAQETMTFTDERQAVARYLPELRKQADVVVVLSHLGYEPTLSLMQSDLLKGVHAVIIGHGRGLSETLQTINGTTVVQNSMGVEILGKLVFTLDSRKKVTRVTGQNIALTEIIPEDKAIKALMLAFYTKERDARKQGGRKQPLPSIQSMQNKYLKMTPQEFMDQMKKEGRAFPMSGSPPPAGTSDATQNP